MKNQIMGKRLFLTREVKAAAANSTQFGDQVIAALRKFNAGDWGETCKADKALNDLAVENGEERLLAVYETCKGRVWIITEWDRSATTVLFPSEY